MSQMTPKEIVHELNKHIIGQDDAKRAVAIALRNRWRRMQLPKELQAEVTPKNILMIGPTGVGKTEIARRLAKLARAPFIKVEATKFTEVGYVGRDVESIIRDLVETSVKMHRETAKERVQQRAQDAAEKRVLDILMPSASNKKKTSNPIGFANEPLAAVASMLSGGSSNGAQAEPETPKEDDIPPMEDNEAYKSLRRRLRNGELDDHEIEIEVSTQASMEIMGPPGMEEMTQQLQDMFSNMNKKPTKKRKMLIKDALRVLQDEEAGKLVNEEEVKLSAIENAEQNGIVFIDEIDKVCKRSDQMGGGDVSREGVQRDLLPLVEGSTVSTKYGMIKTDHILFIASGAFHMSKPSDLIAELQGRLPIRVELKALAVEDFIKILTEPDASLIKQYVALMQTEGVTLDFKQQAIEKLAEVAFQVNEKIENIGARRLHTILEKLLETIAFDASECSGDVVVIDQDYVNRALDGLAGDDDLSRYIL